MIFKEKWNQQQNISLPKGYKITALALALSSMNDEDFEEWYDACGYSLVA